MIGKCVLSTLLLTLLRVISAEVELILPDEVLYIGFPSNTDFKINAKLVDLGNGPNINRTISFTIDRRCDYVFRCDDRCVVSYDEGFSNLTLSNTFLGTTFFIATGSVQDLNSAFELMNFQLESDFCNVDFREEVVEVRRLEGEGGFVSIDEFTERRGERNSIYKPKARLNQLILGTTPSVHTRLNVDISSCEAASFIIFPETNQTDLKLQKFSILDTVGVINAEFLNNVEYSIAGNCELVYETEYFDENNESLRIDEQVVELKFGNNVLENVIFYGSIGGGVFAFCWVVLCFHYACCAEDKPTMRKKTQIVTVQTGGARTATARARVTTTTTLNVNATTRRSNP